MSKINETNYPRRTQANYEDTDMLVIQKAGGNTYTTRIEDLREDCQETLAPALNTMRENLATIEGNTASKAYAKGDYLVFGGRLCKAITSIAVNATLILDTNIELAPVGDELSSISSDLTSLTTGFRSRSLTTSLDPDNTTTIQQLLANITFQSGTEIINVYSTARAGGLYMLTIIMQNVNNNYGLGIAFGYYVGHVYKIENVGRTFDVIQIS